jgi:hypothetical protein
LLDLWETSFLQVLIAKKKFPIFNFSLFTFHFSLPHIRYFLYPLNCVTRVCENSGGRLFVKKAATVSDLSETPVYIKRVVCRIKETGEEGAREGTKARKRESAKARKRESAKARKREGVKKLNFAM